MTATAQEHITRAARTGQEAMSTAMRSWGETAQTVIGLGAGRTGDVPGPDRLVDTWFDAAQEALAAQREFAKALLSIGTPMLDAVGRATSRAVETTQEATQETTQEATEAAQDASRASRTSAARKDG